jgi:hypothetical protein
MTMGSCTPKFKKLQKFALRDVLEKGRIQARIGFRLRTEVRFEDSGYD